MRHEELLSRPAGVDPLLPIASVSYRKGKIPGPPC